MTSALPIAAQREAIIDLLRREPVIVVAGDTGSGKSTQLPQYALEAGRGQRGLIAHTQPRRIAARALAARIAEERGEAVGASVGFRVRFADQVSAATKIVLMTDGLLLAELTRDPRLSRYDTVIVDEAHERTLNIDLLLGVLLRLRRSRPELQVIITSATLEVERVARFFGNAPVVSVSGRGFPIEVRYREAPADGEETDLPTAVLQAYRDLEAEPQLAQGDVLVFLPGERDIADVGELLGRELPAGVEVLPLYSRLSWEQQSRVFARGARRRVVLATNVAETSLTVPGIRAVIDSGLARISRYSARTRLQRLPIEPVSQASADQRKGRCGRIGPGVCVRLYDAEDFAQRAPFTEPEILRTNLAALLLRLAADRLGAAEDFPFIDPPDSRALADGYRLLQELGALDAQLVITRTGREMARLPLDPRLARALLESRRFHAEGDVLAIVAALSVPDPRIVIGGGEGEDLPDPAANDEVRSEFLAYARLWRAYRRAREGARRELRRWCKERRLSLMRLSEWENVYLQVRDRAAELGIRPAEKAASFTGVHRALLAGFATMVGRLDEEGVYQGTRNLRFHLLPGSPLKRRRPRWVMAANIVETSRVFARCVAVVEPAWIESAAAHLVRREYLEPDWDEGREEVVARERTSLLGLILRNDRIVNYGPVSPEDARLIFAREALVYGRMARRPDWLLANDEARRAAERTEERLRRRDLVAPPEALVDFYATALPRQVSSAATLEYFTRHLPPGGRDALVMSPATLYLRQPDPAELAAFPETLRIAGLELPVDYRFAPAEADDGALLRVPLLAVPGLTGTDLGGAIPGFAGPTLDALLRSLPKEARRQLIPVAATAAAAIADLGPAATHLPSLGAWLQDTRGIAATLVRFDRSTLPAYLQPRLAVLHDGHELARGTEPASLRRELAVAARIALDAQAAAHWPDEWRRFEAEELPAVVDLPVPGGTVAVHPALVATGGAVRIGLEWSAAEGDRRHLSGLTELARIALDRPARDLGRQVIGNAPLSLLASSYLKGAELADLIVRRALRATCFPDDALPRTREGFDAAVAQGRAALSEVGERLAAAALGWFTTARHIRACLVDPRVRKLLVQAGETEAMLRGLLHPATLLAAPQGWFNQLPRYLQAEERRWQRLLTRGHEPATLHAELIAWDQRVAGLRGALQLERRWIPEIDELGWWVREYRVSLVAQELKTRGPVSAPRLEERVLRVDAWLTR
jgi:ATP-dependent helicase HrpA